MCVDTLNPVKLATRSDFDENYTKKFLQVGKFGHSWHLLYRRRFSPNYSILLQKIGSVLESF